MANDDEYRILLRDKYGRYCGCLYPKELKLVLRDRKVDTEIDLSPYFVDKAQTDTRQKENTSV